MVGREFDGCRVEMTLEHEVVRWEEEVKGWFRFHGGLTPTTFVYVELRLQLPTIEGQVAALDRLPVIRHHEVIPPGELVEYPFGLRIPPRAGLGGSASVMAILQHAGSWIPATLVSPIFLVPSRCFTEVLELATRLTGLRPEDWRTGAQGDGVKIRLTPPPDLPKRVDSLELELHRANGIIYGQLTVDPVNTGLVGTLKSLTAADLVRLPIRFGEGDLEAAAEQFTSLLRPFIDERGQLPIPSPLAPRPDVLPIPAASPRSSSETLPRPTTGSDEDRRR